MRTTIGQVLVNEALPPAYRDYERRITKGTLNTVLTQLAAKNPEDYPKSVFTLKRLGDEHAFTLGGSFRFKDLKSEVDKARFFQDADREIASVLSNTTLSQEKKDARIAEIYVTAGKAMAKETVEKGVAANNGLAELVAAGAKGNDNQLGQMMATPVLFSNAQNKPILSPVKRSYTEGLTPAEYWYSSYGARQGTVSSKFATAEAGAFSKQVSQATMGMVVTTQDCGTTNGLPTTPEDSDNVGAYLASSAGGYPRDTLITSEVLAELKKRRVARLLTRSPITCEAPKGVCAKCRGLDEFAKLPEIGKNVGILAAHAAGEPITQMALRVKHTGGAAGSTSVASGFKLVEQLTSVPREFPGKAALANVSGTISKIEKAPQGGSYIFVGTTPHYSGAGSTPTVAVGAEVEEGTPLDNGLVNPADVVASRGVGEGRVHMMNALRSAYADADLPVHRRQFEVLSRALVNQAQVDQRGIVEGAIEDDVVDFQHAQGTYKPANARVEPVSNSLVGKYLAKPVLHYTVGTKIHPSIVNTLKEFDVRTVSVEDQEPPLRPLLLRKQDVPHVGSDWITDLYSRNLKKHLLAAVHRGKDAPSHSTSFITSLVRPHTFGKSPRGPAEY